MIDGIIYLHIIPKFWDFEKTISTGNFKIEVIKNSENFYIKKDEISDKLEDDNVIFYKNERLEVEEIVPANQLIYYVRTLESKYNIKELINETELIDLHVTYGKISKEDVINSIDDKFIINLGKFKNEKLKDVLLKNINYFVWLKNNNINFEKLVNENKILLRYLS